MSLTDGYTTRWFTIRVNSKRVPIRPPMYRRFSRNSAGWRLTIGRFIITWGSAAQ